MSQKSIPGETMMGDDPSTGLLALQSGVHSRLRGRRGPNDLWFSPLLSSLPERIESIQTGAGRTVARCIDPRGRVSETGGGDGVVYIACRAWQRDRSPSTMTIVRTAVREANSLKRPRFTRSLHCQEVTFLVVAGLGYEPTVLNTLLE